MTSLKDLREKLSAAESGSRELDVRLLAALVNTKWDEENIRYLLTPQTFEGPHGYMITRMPCDDSFDCPHYTTNLQDAVDLVEKVREQKGEWSVNGLGNAEVFGKWPQARARAATPALALLCALLSALEAKETRG